MYSSDVRCHAIALMARGLSLRSISLTTGVNRATLRDWREHPQMTRATCPRCVASPGLPEPQHDYAYLLGLSRSRHWPCLFPQHAPGRKHDRKIELEPWQQTITSRHPGSFARGLFHSDGCRFVNRVHHRLKDCDRWYEYPRYMFTNESRDILGMCCETLDQLGVSWRFSRRNTISVARREAVARLDEFVGPKY